MATESEIRQEPGEPFKRITTKVARELMEEGNAQIIDVRNPDEYATGHVPGAMLLPVDEIFTRVDELDKDKRLIFVCAVGVRSALACEVAAASGYTELYNLEGGTGAWIDSDYPIET